MMKRVLGFLLAAVMCVTLLPGYAAAADTDKEAQIKAAATAVITSHSASVYQDNADDAAFREFFKYGFFGNGAEQHFNDSHPFVAALFNTSLIKHTLPGGIADAIVYMQQLHLDEMYVTYQPSWHEFYYSCSILGYADNKPSNDKYLGGFQKNTVNGELYSGPSNENDELMKLIVGETNGGFLLRKLETKQSTAVYSIELDIWDDFDFDGDYEAIKDKGYDTSADDRLNNIGFLLQFVGLTEFRWKYQKTLQLEVPILSYCDHKIGNYHWRFDGSTMTMGSDTSDGFEENNATHYVCENNINGTISRRNYFELEHSVELKHDAPWVVEYAVKPASTLALSSFPSYDSSNLSLYPNGQGAVWFMWAERSPADLIKTTPYYKYFYGTETDVAFEGNRMYTYRLENVVHKDGSNMVYLSIYDTATDEQVFAPAAMDGYWQWDYNTENYIYQGDHYNYISGRDLTVNYIGSKHQNITIQEYELWIYENGKGQETKSAFVYGWEAASCAEPAKLLMTCSDCGYQMAEQQGAALGHDYGVYIYNNDASCTADGTQSRTCTRCGDVNTVTAAGTAAGHAYEAVVTAPTYTQQGYTTYICTKCGHSYVDDYTDVKQHSYVPAVTTPTCTEQGFTTYTCSECGDFYVEDYTDIIPHTAVVDPAVAPTCVSKGLTEGSHCGVCGYIIKKQAAISAVKEHAFDKGVVIKEAGYGVSGLMAYTCVNCGTEKHEILPALIEPADKPVKNPFVDVTEGDWFCKHVLWAVANNVTTGKTATTFAPYEGCTRAQVVTFLWAANGKPEPKSMNNPFTDVAGDAWYLKPVLWAVENGITGGTSLTTFGPEQTCTRAQIVTFLYAAQGKPAIGGINVFTDVDDSAWYTTSVIWAAENNVTGGIGEGKFGPDDICTRAQVVTFLNKVYE